MTNILCPSNSIQDSPYKCSSCDPIYNRQLLNGLCECSDGFFQNKNLLSCQNCNESCKTCTFSKNKCLECFENAYLDKFNRCVCQDGYFMNSEKKCQKCSSNCVKCQNKQDQCTLCIDDLNMEAPTCKCPSGMYFDSKTQRCNYCNFNCTTCSDSPSFCLSCSLGYFMTPICIKQCQPNEEYDPNANECVPLVCSNKCGTCIGNKDNCTTCKGDRIEPPYCYCEQYKYDDEIGDICITCPEGEYMDISSGNFECKKCHFSCKRCQGPLVSDCMECYQNQFFLSAESKCECTDKLDIVNDTTDKKPKCKQLMQMFLTTYISETFQQVFRISFSTPLLKTVTKQKLINSLKINLEKVGDQAFTTNFDEINNSYIDFTIISKKIIPKQKVKVYVTNQYEIIGEDDNIISRWYMVEPAEVIMLQDLQDLSSKQANLLKLKQASESVQNNAFIKFVTTYYFFLFILSTLQPTIIFLLIQTQLPITLELFLKIVGQFVFNKNKFFAWYQLSLQKVDTSYFIFVTDVTEYIGNHKPPIYEIEQLGFMENFLYNTQIPILIVTLLSITYWIFKVIDKFQFQEIKKQPLIKITNQAQESNKQQHIQNGIPKQYYININGLRVNGLHPDQLKSQKMDSSLEALELTQIKSSNILPDEEENSNMNTNTSNQESNQIQSDRKIKKIQVFLQNAIVSNMESNFVIYFISIGIQINNIQSENIVNRISVYLCFFFFSQFIYFHLRCFYLMRKGRGEEIPKFTQNLKSDNKYYFHFYSLVGKIIIIVCILLNRYNQIACISIITLVEIVLLAYILLIRPFKSTYFFIFKIIGTSSYFLSWLSLLLFQIKKQQIQSISQEFYQQEDIDYMNNLGFSLTICLSIFNGIYLLQFIIKVIKSIIGLTRSFLFKKEIHLIVPFISYSQEPKEAQKNQYQTNVEIELFSQNNLKEDLLENELPITPIDGNQVNYKLKSKQQIMPKSHFSSTQIIQKHQIKFQSTSILGIPITNCQKK